MDSKAHFSNCIGLNEINPAYDSVIDESNPITDEKLIFDAGKSSVYCNGNPRTVSDCLPVEFIKIEASATYFVNTSGEQCSRGIFTETKVKLENADFEEDIPITTDENCEDTFMEEKKPNIFIKSSPEEYGTNKFNCHGIQILRNTDRDRRDCKEYTTLHCMKDEKITADDNYLEEKEAVESKLYNLFVPLIRIFLNYYVFIYFT